VRGQSSPKPTTRTGPFGRNPPWLLGTFVPSDNPDIAGRSQIALDRKRGCPNDRDGCYLRKRIAAKHRNVVPEHGTRTDPESSSRHGYAGAHHRTIETKVSSRDLSYVRHFGLQHTPRAVRKSGRSGDTPRTEAFDSGLKMRSESDSEEEMPMGEEGPPDRDRVGPFPATRTNPRPRWLRPTH